MRVEETETYREWINALKDRTGRARIQVRVDRLVHGNPGQHRDLTDGVLELKGIEHHDQARRKEDDEDQDPALRCGRATAHSGRNGSVSRCLV